MTDLSHTFKKAQLEFNNGVRKTLLLTEQRNTADKKKLAQKNKEVSKLVILPCYMQKYIYIHLTTHLT